MSSPDLRLLTPDEPPPVRLLRPQGISDFVLAADHAGRLIPRALGTLGVAQNELGRHIAWDIGIAAVTEALSELLDATAVLQTYSRLVIDCNRAPGHPTSIPTISELTRIPGNEGLSAGRAGGAQAGDLRPLPRGDRRADRCPRSGRAACRAGRDAQLHAGVQGRGAQRRGRRALSSRDDALAHHARPACAPRAIW